jgi:hypothetical protein
LPAILLLWQHQPASPTLANQLKHWAYPDIHDQISGAPAGK